MKKQLACLVLMLAFAVACFPVHTRAQSTPYDGYTYDADGSEQPAPALYSPEGIIWPSGEAAPSDIFAWQGQLYALSSDGRLLIYSEMLEEAGEIALTDNAGAPMPFSQAGGLFICESGIYLSDMQAQQVHRFTIEGQLDKTFSKPDSPIYDQSIAFSVNRIVVDGGGNVYAVVQGLYAGAVIFSSNGDFLGFFGASEVEMTLAMQLDQTWKRMLTEEQQQAMTRFVPVAYTSFDIDDENFVYTCSRNAATLSTRVRKLSPSGRGLWDDRDLLFGDNMSGGTLVSGLAFDSQLVDIDIAQDGFLNVLDTARGRVFQYDEAGGLLGVFGGRGTQLGTFVNAAAIDSIGQRVYVLDADSGCITSFLCTQYGALMQEASTLYNGGEYEEALPLWKKVHAMNALSQPAATGIGKALMQRGDVGGALRYFMAGGSRQEYSRAFEEYRLAFMRQNFAWLLLCAALPLTGLWLWRRWRAKKPHRKNLHFAMLFSPVDTLSDLLYSKGLSPRFTIGMLAYWFALEILKYFGTGFIFNQNNPDAFILFLPLMGTVVLYSLFCATNWGVSTLSDGKGTLKTICLSSVYVLLPYLITQTLTLLLSLVLVQEEGMFLVMINGAGLVWSAVLLFSVICGIHDYALGKAFGNLLLTVFGMAVVVFLLFMCVVLFEQAANLVMTIYNELTLRV